MHWLVDMLIKRIRIVWVT